MGRSTRPSEWHRTEVGWQYGRYTVALLGPGRWSLEVNGAVRSEHQKRGVGSGLVQSGIQQLSDMSVQWLFVYGDPQYYGRFGFTAEVAEGFVPPYPLEFPFGWLGMKLENWPPESLVNA